MKDWFGKHFSEKPSVQLCLFDKSKFVRVPTVFPAVLLRENGERTSGSVRREKRDVVFRTERGNTFVIPGKYARIDLSADVWVIAVAEAAMREQCSLHGLWDSCYFGGF